MAGLYGRRLLRLLFFGRFHWGRRSRCRLSDMCKLVRFVAGKRAAASHGSFSFFWSRVGAGTRIARTMERRMLGIYTSRDSRGISHKLRWVWRP
jgi:hypothetical protein